jgi:catechol 2,3-dioxygenase-like lactoylglutathione lyase family enzyme
MIIKEANVTVIISDMDKAVRFYRDTLGLNLDFRRNNQYAVFKTQGLTIGLNPMQRGLEPGRCESLSIGFLVDNLDSVINELKGKGVVFSPNIIVEDPLRIAFFTDQDKNPLYICEYIQNK